MQPLSPIKIIITGIALFLIAGGLWLKHEPAATSAGSRPGAEISHADGQYDLARDEELGGHTLHRHIGRSDEQLMERLDREQGISAASTYNDRVSAERTVAASFAREHDRVESWLNRSDAHPNFVLQFHGTEPIGRSVRRGEHASQPCYDAAVVLRWDGERRFHVLTTYPEPSRGR